MAKIKFRRDTAAAWTQANPVLAQGEPGFEHDTGLLKIGDGATAWNSLDYASGDASSLTDDKAVTVTVGNTDYFAIVNRANNDDDGVESSAVAYDSEGNLITLHISEVYIGNDTNRDRLIISKFDSSANLIWQKQIQEDMDVSQAHDICIDDDDNIIVVLSQDNGSNDDTVSAIKYSSAGSELWKKDYHPAVDVAIYEGLQLEAGGVTVGSFNGTTVDVITLSGDWAYLSADNGWSLQESGNNGSTFSTIASVLGIGAYNSGTNTTPLYIAANSPVEIINNNPYQYRVTRQGPNSNLELGGAVTDGTHTFITASYQEDTGNGYAPLSCLMKIANSDGALVWAKTAGLDDTGGPTFPNQPYGMEIDSSGNLVIVGVQYSPGPTFNYVSKYSGISGTEIWTKVLVLSDGSNYLTESTGGDVTADSQGNVFVSINCSVQIVHEDDDTLTKTAVVITKLNSSGVVQWTRRVGPGPCASVGTGIDSDSLGNVYLSALTTTQKNPTRDIVNSNPIETRDVLAIAKYSTSGVVLWQRYIEAPGYEFYQSKSTDNGTSNFDYDENSGRNLAISTTGKLAVQVTVRKRDLDDYVYDSRYWESITFQIDQDGREMTIGNGDEKFTVKESRIPGKLVTLLDLAEAIEETFTVVVTDITEDIEVTVPTITYAAAELAQQVIKSAPYEYVFGNDGSLTIPNDGDVKLTQTQIGWFSIFGMVSDDNFDVWNRANCVDTATGDVYVTGQEDGEGRAYVARYNSAGEILWSIRLEDNWEGFSTRGNAIKMNPVTGNVTVLAEFAGGENALIVEIDPDTAQIVNRLGFKDAAGGDAGSASTTPYDFDFQSDGSIVAVGRKYDERRLYSVVPQTGSTTDVLIINRSDLAGDEYTSEWRISGTGFGFTSMSFNYYSGLTGTVRQGSGANFNIIIDGAGAIDNSSAVNAGGSNYRVGHKILIPYTAVGGSTNDADIIVTVTAIDNVSTGAITGTAMGYYGAGGGVEGTYNAVSGANYQTGSGFEFDFNGPFSGTDYSQWEDTNISAVGTNYVTGDVVVIPGTQLGGTSPANDLTAIINANSGSVTGFQNFTGTSQNTTYRIYVSETGVDFGGAGNWILSYPVGGEAFVWTNAGAGWNKVVGSLNPSEYASERYFSVAVGEDGSIYAAGEIYTDDSTTVYQAVISKFNSTGTHQWSRALNTHGDGNGHSAKCVAVRGATVAVSSYDSYETNTIITKLNSTTGNILWQRRTDSNDDSSVAIDTNGDIYAVTEANFENRFEDVIKVIRFASNGEPIWRKFFGTSGVNNSGTHEYFKNGRNITLDAEHFYVSGYTTAFDSDADRAFLVKLPKSGDCDGYYGGWTVQTEAYDVAKVNITQANTFTPNIRPGDFRSWDPDILSNWWDPSQDDYYQQLDPVVDRDGGAIEFADGTRQTTSAQQIPQLKISTGADHRLSIDDMGKHIYVTNNRTNIIVPYDYDNPLPVGFTVVIVNNSGGTIDIEGDGGGLDIRVPGVDIGQYWLLDSPGMATLLKIDADQNIWFMTGNVSLAP
jgi:hypothetical protein